MRSANAVRPHGSVPAPVLGPRLPFLPWSVAVVGMLLVYYGTELAAQRARASQWSSLTSLIDLMRPGLLGAFALYAAMRFVARPGKLLGPWQATAAWAAAVAVSTALLTRLQLQPVAASSDAVAQALGWSLEVMVVAAHDIGLTLALLLLGLSAAQLMWSSLAAGKASKASTGNTAPAPSKGSELADDGSAGVQVSEAPGSLAQRGRSSKMPTEVAPDVRAALASATRALQICIAAMERAGYFADAVGDATPADVVTFSNPTTRIALDLRCWSDDPHARSIDDAAAVKDAQPWLGWVVVLAASSADIDDEARELARSRGVLLADRSAVVTWLERSAHLSLDPAGALAQLLATAHTSAVHPQICMQRSRSSSAMSFGSGRTSSARKSGGSH